MSLPPRPQKKCLSGTPVVSVAAGPAPRRVVVIVVRKIWLPERDAHSDGLSVLASRGSANVHWRSNDRIPNRTMGSWSAPCFRSLRGVMPGTLVVIVRPVFDGAKYLRRSSGTRVATNAFHRSSKRLGMGATGQVR